MCSSDLSRDGMVRVWSVETWGCVQTVEAYAAASVQKICRLAVSAGSLVGGSASDPYSASEEYEVRVWELETLRPLHTIKQPAGKMVHSLAGDLLGVWGAVGNEILVWGGREPE